MSPHLAQTELELAATKGDSLLPLERRVHLATCEACQARRAAVEETVQAGGPETEEGPAPQPPLSRGDSVGRYLILELLGQGGMGSVYGAYDAELDRKVAVKVLRADSVPSRLQEAQLRLLREAQAMARISHPNVIAVHDVGTVGNGIFLAMERVDGGTLKAWLRHEPRTTGVILDAFLQAGQGLLAAHRAGLVHRDFKPENVLMGKDGRVFVTDFGLARLAADAPDAPQALASDAGADSEPKALASTLTRAGAVMGTPRYMSPEQHLGKTPDATSDQFSFCAALYWALFKQRPFEPEQLADAAETAEAEGSTLPLKSSSRTSTSPIREPPRDATVSPRVRRALMRGLSLKPQDRFPTLEALLEELTPPPPRRMWPWLVGLGAVGILALGGVAAELAHVRQAQVCSGAPTKLIGAWDDQVREGVQRAFLATGARDAQAQFDRVAKRLDGYAARWSGEYHDTCAATAIRKEQPEAVLSLRMLCLDRHVGQLRAVTQLLSSPDASLAPEALKMVDGLQGFEDCADVEALTSAQPLPSDPTVREEIRGVQTKLDAAGALKLAGRYQASKQKADEAVDRATPLAYPPLTAEALYVQGILLGYQAKYDAAGGTLRRAFDEADAGKVDTLRVQIASELVHIADLSSSFEGGLRWADTGRAVLRRLGRRPDLESGLLNNLGTLYLDQARLEDAVQAYQRALEMLKAVPGSSPLERATYQSNLASAYAQSGRDKDALPLIQQVIALYQSNFGADYPKLANAYVTLSIIHSKEGATDPALLAADRALEITRKTFGERHPWLAFLEDNKASILQSAGRFEPALEAYQAALTVALAQKAPNVLDLAYTRGGIGQCLVELGRGAEAIHPLEQALADLPPGDEVERGNDQFALARALWATPSARPRAKKLALEAQERFARASAQEPLSRVKAWLAQK